MKHMNHTPRRFGVFLPISIHQNLELSILLLFWFFSALVVSRIRDAVFHTCQRTRNIGAGCG
jgi:hypothetical protein